MTRTCRPRTRATGPRSATRAASPMTGSRRTRPCARSTTGLALRAFIAAVLGVDTLHPDAGPFGSLNINVLAPGQQLGWRFDSADFVTTLMLRPAEAGGLYEYAPGLRAPEDEATDALARVLDGARERSTWRRAPSSCSAAAPPCTG